MKKLFFFTSVIGAILLGQASGQTIFLKNGKSMQAAGVQRQGDSLAYQSQVGTGTATLTMALTEIDRVEFPDSTLDKVTNVRDEIFQGKFDHALGDLESLLLEQETYKGIPGNLHFELIALKAKALMRLDRFSEAQPLLQEIVGTSTDPDLVLGAKLLLAKQDAQKGDPKVALDAYSNIAKQTVNPNVRAEAWLFKGQLYASQKDHQNAVLALLHIPAFFTSSPSMPTALLAGAEELDFLGDQPSAAIYLTDLVNKFPSAAEAEKGKIELRRIQNIIKSTKKS